MSFSSAPTSTVADKVAPRERVLHGTVRVFLAEALIVPTGLLMTAFLTRRLGPDAYGIFILAVTLVTWIEWSIASLFARSTIKLVSEADDWRAAGATALRLNGFYGVLASLVLCAAALPIAAWLHEPSLTGYLCLLAWEIPLFTLSQAHRNILVGLGRFRQRANVTSVRWLARLLLIVLLVGAGFSIYGALWGSIASALVELGMARWYVRPNWRPSDFPARQFYLYALPLFGMAISLRLYDKIDLFALKALGGSNQSAAWYGTAQNLSMAPNIFALAFSPLLLAAQSRTLRENDLAGARTAGRTALRAVVALLPSCGLTAGAATEIVTLVFGHKFAPTAPLLAVLVFGSLAICLLSVATAILTAWDKANWTFAVAGPLVPVGCVGYWFVMPHWNAIGISWITTIVATAGALVSLLLVYIRCRVLVPAATTLRSIALCIAVYFGAEIWHTTGVWLFFKLIVLSLLVVLGFALSGEWSVSELKSAQRKINLFLVQNRIFKRTPTNL